MATFFYARVSTSEQTLEHQQAQAEQSGFKFDHVIADQGVSGVTVPMRERPEGKRLFDMLREGDTLVVRWVDRLGRNYKDVTETIREFVDRGIIIRTIIDGMAFNGSTSDHIQMAARDALIGFMAAMAQAQVEATKVAQRAGIDHAKSRPDAYRGRKPSFTKGDLETVQDILSKGTGISEIAKTTGLSRQTIYRIKNDRVSAEKALELWKA